MGYTTDFTGSFRVDKKLDDATFELLKGLSSTRRMARKGLDKTMGIEGEFFVDGKGFAGQDDDASVVDHNRPPSTQPGLWCQWAPVREDDGDYICWDGGEKFYEYVEWIQYLIKSVLAPRGYTITGVVKWQGEEMDDRGKLTITKNKITTKRLE